MTTGDRIAQQICEKIEKPEVVEVNSLHNTQSRERIWVIIRSIKCTLWLREWVQFCLFQFFLLGIITIVGESDQSITRGGIAFLNQGQFLLTNAKWTIAFDVPIGNFKQQADH